MRDNREKRDKRSQITRRDFIGGVSVAVGGYSLFGAGGALGATSTMAPVTGKAVYPPLLTGMRGAHAGSFEAAHAHIQGQRWQATPLGEHYDLVVVGAGISGLTAAYLYRKQVKPDARILVLDNHDDFGGHAKRNEFSLGSRASDKQTIIGFGGTMFMEAPSTYPQVAKEVVRDLGVDSSAYARYHEHDLFASLNMQRCSFFDKETFGADFLVPRSENDEPVLNGSPLGEATQSEFKRLFANQTNYLQGKTANEQRQILQSYSYAQYLKEFGGFSDTVLNYYQRRSHGVWGIGCDALPALMAWTSDYPGFAGIDPGIPDSFFGPADDSIFHFPDGNASIARLLVRKMIPAAAAGDSMEDIVTADFSYDQLDLPDNPTRIRLNSTVVRMAHHQGKLSNPVELDYINGAKASTITADKVIWAGYQAMVPHICPDVSVDQAMALKSCERAPLVYTNVLIRNWESLARLNLYNAYCPGSFFQFFRITFPVSIGDYQFAQSPEAPVILHLQHIPTQPGLPAAEQFRAGRRTLLQMPFSTFENNVRDQLGRVLGPGGFDPAEDILAITVNRWPHGYAYSAMPDTGEVVWWPELWEGDNRPWEASRQPLGNIAFAGTDAASNAMTEAAMEEAARAVRSLAGGS
ncbi:MAG: NAD(P)-binding protein [Pseudomonadota bacterium]